MPWATETIDKIPPVYRDFLLYLRPIVTSRTEVMRFNGFLLGTISGALNYAYEYEPRQYVQIADNLKNAGLIEEDEHGFLRPTPKGETLIEALAADADDSASRIPPLPEL